MIKTINTQTHTHIQVWGFVYNKLKKKKVLQRFLPTFHLRIATRLRNKIPSHKQRCLKRGRVR